MSGDKMTHELLLAIVKASEQALRDIWARRKRDDDVIVLADVRRDDARGVVAGWWSAEDIARVVARGGAGDAAATFMPALQPAGPFLSGLGQGSWAQRGAAKELRAHAQFPHMVPLLVVYRMGLWATGWAPPGSEVVVVRYQPDPEPDRN